MIFLLLFYWFFPYCIQCFTFAYLTLSKYTFSHTLFVCYRKEDEKTTKTEIKTKSKPVPIRVEVWFSIFLFYFFSVLFSYYNYCFCCYVFGGIVLFFLCSCCCCCYWSYFIWRDHNITTMRSMNAIFGYCWAKFVFFLILAHEFRASASCLHNK